MKIVSASFVVRIEDDDENLEVESVLDEWLSSIGFAGPVNCKSQPDPDDDLNCVVVFEAAEP